MTLMRGVEKMTDHNYGRYRNKVSAINQIAELVATIEDIDFRFEESLPRFQISALGNPPPEFRLQISDLGQFFPLDFRF